MVLSLSAWRIAQFQHDLARARESEREREKVRGARAGDIGGHRKKRRLHSRSSVHEAIARQENE